ncbi:DUF4062 domain-containing protein [Granulicoccus sp. GXG6511]|uniref:DUF4062 domain-containing protein n=1 Tax=Granulicoccus sp. GXG6511 TaxID=3381351 RepID=UPI003D7DE9D9
MKPTARVFISSARGQQLDSYRARVIQVVRRYGFEPVFMEEFTPDRRPPASYCRELVQGCDAMVLLVAHRYGSLVPGEDRSYTELEYDTAIELPDVDLMAWIVDDNCPWRPAEIDQADDRDRLERFKQKLGTHTVGRFADPEGFQEQIAYALADLRQRLNTREAGRSRAPTVVPPHRRNLPRAPEKAAFPVYVGGLTFTGRTEQLEWLDSWANGTDGVAVIEAIGGTGKSALTWEWFSDRAPAAIDGLAGRFWWSFYDSSNTLRKFQQVLLAYLTGCAPAEAEALDAVALADAVLHELEARPFLVVMDGFERLLNAYHRFDASTVTDDEVDRLLKDHARAVTDPNAHDFVRRLATLRTSKVLISSRLLPDALTGFGNILLRGVSHLRLPGLRTTETRHLLSKLGVQNSHSEVKLFFDRLDNHPLLIGIVAGLVRKHRPAPGDFDAWVADPQAGQRFTVAGLSITERSHHILEQALAGLDNETLVLLQGLAITGGAMTWEMVQIINPFLPGDPLRIRAPWPQWLQDFVKSRQARERIEQLDDPREPLTRLDAALSDLQDRGLLWWNTQSNTYDLHPVVRAYASEGTSDVTRRAANVRLGRDHFGRVASTEDPARVNSVEDLVNTIQFFRALLGAGAYEGATRLWQDKLHDALLHRLGANLVVVQLLTDCAGSAAADPDGVLEWYLAWAEGGMGRLSQALARRLRCLQRSIERRRADHLLPALNNVVESLSAMERSADETAYRSWLSDFTTVLDSQPGDLARLELYHLIDLMSAERYPQALRQCDLLERGPDNPLDPHWRSSIAGMRARAVLRMGQDPGWQVRLTDQRFGTSMAAREEWAAFVWEWAVQQGDWGLAHEAAMQTDRLARVQGQESLPVEVAWALAQLGRRDEAAAAVDSALLRFDRVHPALRPHYATAQALLALDRPAEAITHADLTYRQAWADGPSTHSPRAVRLAGELLAELGMTPPALPERASDPSSVPFAAELGVWLEELRAQARTTEES